MTDVRDALLVAKASDGTLIRRPLSPHAGIYRWPITMVASILNRITGVAISVGHAAAGLVAGGGRVRRRSPSPWCRSS